MPLEGEYTSATGDYAADRRLGLQSIRSMRQGSGLVKEGGNRQCQTSYQPMTVATACQDQTLSV